MSTNHSHFSWLPWALIIVGIVLMAFWGVHRYFYNQSIAMTDALLASYAIQPSYVPTPIHITVGDSVNLPVVESGRLPDGTWAVSETSANHVRQSASPGQEGNIVIYAHNLTRLFGNIQWVKTGELVAIRTTNGALHTYQITSTSVVYPSQTQLLQPTKHEVLTMYTCTGLFDSERFVVVAIPTTSQ